MEMNQTHAAEQNAVSVKLNRKLLLTHLVLVVSVLLNVKLLLG
ncbi:hypothetical protein NBRC111894_3849 [Sporolactobacillus inulinus]|uniref:Uncharacterized protein n=1 Tax=Sporolactobacillus inulinus TaxID=2078 RepID=A0A4Y1ZGQ5_9BACL|nr:hypothetical protein [Sporolactobacillus inulinus]GAY78295.1 hypothetical protein NBRC111894_3849 [Sporolactobacillus inulinus]